jgi:predicted HAD superfamily phosphohydrolase
MIPNFIIPSEYEMLEALSKNSGVSVVWNCNAKPFIQDEKIQLVWDSAQMPSTEVFLLSGKNETLTSAFQEIESELKKVLE